jgi:hypothetical protein
LQFLPSERRGLVAVAAGGDVGDADPQNVTGGDTSTFWVLEVPRGLDMSPSAPLYQRYVTRSTSADPTLMLRR